MKPRSDHRLLWLTAVLAALLAAGLSPLWPRPASVVMLRTPSPERAALPSGPLTGSSSPEPTIASAPDGLLFADELEDRLRELQDACGIESLVAACEGSHCAFTYEGAVGRAAAIRELLVQPELVGYRALTRLGWMAEEDTPCGAATARAYAPGWASPIRRRDAPVPFRYCPAGTRDGGLADLAAAARLCNALMLEVEGPAGAVYVASP